MRYEELSAKDRETVERQLGRHLRGQVLLAARCPHGEAQVIATSPLLPDGEPFPTLYWLTCPLLRKAVSKLESGDFRELLRRKIKASPAFAAALKRAESHYENERERWVREDGQIETVRAYFAGRSGIGGTKPGGLKCLHAHLAHFLAGGENPVGEEIAQTLSGLQDSGCNGDCGPFLD
jgi:hypothetical protein